MGVAGSRDCRAIPAETELGVRREELGASGKICFTLASWSAAA